jgi:hypothetical protein
MADILKKRPKTNPFLRFFMSREVVAALLLTGIALLTWALCTDRGVLFPYQETAQQKLNQIPLYDHGDLDSQTVYMDDIQQ